MARLRASLSGTVLVPGDQGYDTARRLWDRRFDPRPAVVAYCADSPDVATCLAFARTQRMAFRVRSGGHSFAGYSACDGMILDVSRLDSIAIDAPGLRATVQAGCAFEKLGPALAGAGVDLPIGDWPSVSIAGFMMGGGYGLTARTHGMNCDHVVAVQMMLADGRIVRADASCNADLFWAVRGGAGGSFGVLLEITYRLLPHAPTSELVIGWPLASDAGRAAAVQALLALQAGFARGSAAAATNISAMALFSATGAGGGPQPWLVLDAIQVGDAAALDAAVRPLLAIAGAQPGFNPQTLFRNADVPPLARAARYVARDLSAAEWDRVLGFVLQTPNPLSIFYLDALGGAINAVPPEACAFIHRDAAFNAWLDVFWEEDAQMQPALAFQRDWCALMAPLTNGRSYQNFPDAALAEFAAAYWGEAYPALAAVKRKYDPDCRFAFPQAVGRDAPAPVWPPAVLEALARPIDTHPAGKGISDGR
jgi:FAD/FMN-containing dehydrogenase